MLHKILAIETLDINVNSKTIQISNIAAVVNNFE